MPGSSMLISRSTVVMPGYVVSVLCQRRANAMFYCVHIGAYHGTTGVTVTVNSQDDCQQDFIQIELNITPGSICAIPCTVLMSCSM